MKHTYFDQQQQPVPSVTTVIGQLDKPYLLKWANSLGFKGYNFEKVRNNAAETGTIAHTMIENFIKGEESDFSFHPFYRPAKNSFTAFQKWLQENEVEFLGSEISLVDGTLRFGGTIDIIARVNGKTCVIDAKTSNQLSLEYNYQVAAYAMLLETAMLNDKGETRTFPTYSPDCSLLLRLDKKQAVYEEKWLTKVIL